MQDMNHCHMHFHNGNNLPIIPEFITKNANLLAEITKLGSDDCSCVLMIF